MSELVAFDPETAERPLRIWDFVGDDLLERRLLEPWAQSRHLGGFWLPVEQPETGWTLRLSHDPAGTRLFPTLADLAAREAEGRRAEAEARRAAELRVRELEAELRRRSP